MTGTSTAVHGVYPSATDTDYAIDTLIDAGFSGADIAVWPSDARRAHDRRPHQYSKAPEGTTAGVTAGGVIGGTIGVLAGVGALALPGIGPFVAAGPMVSGLAGLGVGGAFGGLLGALIGRGIPAHEAKRYEGRVKDGGNWLSVHCRTSEQIELAKTF